MTTVNGELKILDLGCGRRKIKDAIGVDRVKLDTVDIVHDLTKFPYPFGDNSIDKIYCSHILEHFDVYTRNKALEEIWRTLKVSGQFEMRVPHAFSIGGFLDPTHASFFTWGTMDYYTKDHFFSYYSNVRFKILKKWLNVVFLPESLKRHKKNSFFKVKRFINEFLSRVINKIFGRSDILPDFIIRIFPFYEAEIVWQLEKE